MRFSPALIERLRSYYTVSEVIGKRMPVKKHGREYQGLCPFHNEKSPSFTINDDKGFFHCFGCGAHGDVIEFVRRYDRVSYGEAVENLARDAGMQIEKPSPAQIRKMEEEKTLYEVMEAAAEWFERQLFSSDGMLAKDYVEGRGLLPETIRRFRIGYAADGKASLHQYLNSRGFSLALQKEAGLVVVPEAGGVRDRFRGRVMFPIRDVSGKVIAFGGRLIAASDSGKGLPKYLNSPETPLFKKGEVLYNLDLAKNPARDGGTVVVMEGYMDVVMSAQAGINYGVATLGTAVTPEHLRVLWKLAKEPVMCLDGDAAGKRAMLRAAELVLPLLKPSYSLRFAILPKGDDPDSYIQKNSKASFEKIIISSRRLSQVLWEDIIASDYNLDSPEGLAAADDAVQRMVAKIADNTVRQHYQNHLRKALWDHGAAHKTSKTTKKAAASSKVGTQARTTTLEVKQRIHQQESADLEKLAARLLDILAGCPSLLNKSKIEEALLRLNLATSELSRKRDELLAVAQEHALPSAEKHVERNAMSLWVEASAAYELAALEMEYAEITQRMGAFNNEADFLRFLELQNNLNIARSRRRFAPAEAENDVA